MKKALLVLATAGLALLAVAPAQAHHAFAAEFDADKPIKLKGTVTKMEWINPHAWIHIDVKGEDGTVTNWMIEAAAPNSLLRRGWNKNLPLELEPRFSSKDSRRRTSRTAPTAA